LTKVYVSLTISYLFNLYILYSLLFRWFIETMSPLSLTEHPATRLLLAALKPDFDVPSRRTLGRDMDKAWEKARGDLINILYSQKTVATTADSWTAHNRAFLGMTVHWIAQDSLQRKKATLACKELKVENNQNIKLINLSLPPKIERVNFSQ
jgi:hypothetical protein